MNHIPVTPGFGNPISYDDPRKGGTEAEIRRRAYPEPLILIPGLLTTGLTLLAAGPKVGKSVISQQIEHYLSAGRPFKGFPRHDVRHRVMVWDLEGNGEATQDTSFRLAPDANDDDFNRIEYYYQSDLPMGGGMVAMLGLLAELLTAAHAAGDPYSYVRIDTMRLFTGANAGRTNAYDFDAQANAALNQLGLSHRCAILELHHLTKASEESGDWLERLSGSMGVSGSATTIWLLERARNSRTGVLRSTSRRLAEAEHALTYEAGIWAFAENLTVDQAMHTGVPRKIIDYLTRHPIARWSDLKTLGPPATVRKALTRLSNARTVECVDGQYALIRAPEVASQQPDPPRPGPDDVPTARPSGWPEGSIGDALWSHTENLVRLAEETTPVEQTDPPPVIRWAAEPEPVDDADAEGAVERAESALGRLKDAIGTVESRPCHPIPLIRRDDRDAEPWTIAARLSDNRHRWLRPDVEQLDRGAQVVIIDRRASYPSALSSVSVVPNKLHHTGPLETLDARRAGMCLVRVPEHDGAEIGHVLGARAEPGETLWVSAPSVRALVKVHGSAEILDSWTGKSVANLFDDYYRWCRTTRAELEARRPASDAPGSEAWHAQYAEFKRTSSIAIRLLFPKSRESGLWRPDWHAAVLAEANLRHWWKAHRSGAVLLSMANTDEAVFLVPPDAPDGWLPKGYREGPAFGDVGVKGRMTLSEWIDSKGRRARGRR